MNVANLLLARSTARQREFSVRAALGAGQIRILRQLLTEAFCSRPWAACWADSREMGNRCGPSGSSGNSSARRGNRAPSPGTAFHHCSIRVTGIMFGLLPAMRMSRTDISGRLKDSGRAIAGSRSRMQSVLVMGEMAMALVLLVGAGLMCRTLMGLWKVDPGFDPRNVSYFEVTPSPSLASQPPDAIHAALRQISAKLHSVTGSGGRVLA